MAIDIVRELHLVTPETISFTRMDYEDGKSLVLGGTAGHLSDVLKYVEALSHSVYLKDVKVKNVSNHGNAEQKIADFEITATLVKNGA